MPLPDAISSIPSLGLCHLPTPLEKSAGDYGLVNKTLMIKRDDLTGHCFGGNKERKLDRIAASPEARDAQAFITLGAPQSNHCRMTAALAARLGIEAHLILIGEQLPSEGNLFLDQLLGASIHFCHDDHVQDKIAEVQAALKARNLKTFFIEGGGHTPAGFAAYALAAQELKQQCDNIDFQPDSIVVTCGTGTTHAGLAAGCAMLNWNVRVIGISIARKAARCREVFRQSCSEACTRFGITSTIPEPEIYDDYIGEGYAIPTPAALDAIRAAARGDGLILDPAYTGKTFAAMLDLCHKNLIGNNIIFIHSGGQPGIFSENSRRSLSGSNKDTPNG